MERIELRNVVPSVFASKDLSASQVWSCNLTLERGKNYLISAESGTGKSSLCSFVYGYRQDFSGIIAIDGNDVKSLSVERWCELRTHNIAYLPQDMRLFGELTALENVELKNGITSWKNKHEILEMFSRLGIEDKVNSLVSRMSIGQQQRVAIIRSLCQPFDFLLLDEPVSHLDELNNDVVSHLVMEEADRQGAAVIATSVGNNVKIRIDKELKL
ncbi:MAG: ATP-binding cassette domain-containing protein [Muribaculaceae bacterium]|nr:ATP-binding cassette domain-containing protein [Muribaculaceae bacterium]